jgi:hypothetical protein
MGENFDVLQFFKVLGLALGSLRKTDQTTALNPSLQ